MNPFAMLPEASPVLDLVFGRPSSTRAASRSGGSIMMNDSSGLITIPGVAFGWEASRYLRLSFSAEEPVIREGVSRLGAALEKLHPSI